MQSEEQVIYTILGAALCLGGWIIFWLGSRIIGLALGMGFGFAFGQLLSLVLKLDPNATLLVLLACSLMGAFGGFLLMRVTTMFLFALSGFLFGALLGRLAADYYFISRGESFQFTMPVSVSIAAAGALVAALAVWMQKYIVIIITSYVGATFLVGGVEFLARGMPWSFPALLLVAIAWQVLLVTRLIQGGSRQAKEPSA